MKFLAAIVPLLAAAATATPVVCPMMRRFIPECGSDEHRCGICGVQCCTTEASNPPPVCPMNKRVMIKCEANESSCGPCGQDCCPTSQNGTATATPSSSTATSTEIPWITAPAGTRILSTTPAEGEAQ